MSWLGLLISLLFCLLAVVATSLNRAQTKDACTVTSYTGLASAISSCSDIIISGITVPAGETLNLDLQDGTTVTLQDYIKFDYNEWDGPFVIIKGNNIIVQGASGHTLDGQGSKYWDGQGGSGGKTKPIFFRIQASGTLKDINVLNCPHRCVSISGSKDLTISNWNIDTSAGDTDNLGRNTDGFDISSSTNIVIENSVVKNQDDCVAINQGSNMRFSGLSCSGSHGLSLSVGLNKNDASGNTVSDILFADCTVANSRNGIHIKTHSDGAEGYIKNVTYSNIKLSGITYYGINVQEDYENGGSTGTPKGNVPITDLTVLNVAGTMSGKYSMPVYILCGDGGCSDWKWGEISISGNEQSNSCNFAPDGFSC